MIRLAVIVDAEEVEGFCKIFTGDDFLKILGGNPVSLDQVYLGLDDMLNFI